MRICITFGGVRHCFEVPILEWPVHFKIPGPRPVNYAQLLQDGILISSFQEAAKNISDNAVRGAVENGLGAALKAMQKRAGEHISIEAE
jgi:hypothetical protein